MIINPERKINPLSLRRLIPFAIMMPSIAIGALAMYRYHVSIAIWGSNIACFMLLNFLTLIMASQKFNFNKSRYKKLVLPFAIGLLLLTFASQGMAGVHRWISIGAINVNIAMIVMPIILIELWNVLKTKGLKFGLLISLVILFALYFQPDASQLTGFAVPMMIILSRNTNSKVIRSLIICVSTLFIVYSWVYLDNLAPVSYVESILDMVANMGGAWLILGVISLVILPIPFLLFPPKDREFISKCVGCYYIIIILSTLIGNFPVPLMGYGISPIIGFFISLMWYLNSKYGSNKI